MDGLGDAQTIGLVMFRCRSCGRVRELRRMTDPTCPCGGKIWRLLAFTESDAPDPAEVHVAASAQDAHRDEPTPAIWCPLAVILLGEPRPCARGDGCAWWAAPGMAPESCLIRELFPRIDANRGLAAHLRAIGGPQEWAPAA